MRVEKLGSNLTPKTSKKFSYKSLSKHQPESLPDLIHLYLLQSSGKAISIIDQLPLEHLYLFLSRFKFNK